MANELSPQMKKVYEGMLKIGATSDASMRTADDITRASGLGKDMVNNALTELRNRGIVKRVAREKSAGYYIIKTL